MIADCVGLDIGKTAFKAVRFRRRLTGRESVEYFHLPLPQGRREQAEPAHRAGMLRNFLWQHGLYGGGEIVTALSCQDVFVRTLSFPFRDASKLAQVVPFEMENLIPMALEDVTVGSLLLPARESQEGVAKSKGSDVLVTAAPKEKSCLFGSAKRKRAAYRQPFASDSDVPRRQRNQGSRAFQGMTLI